MSNWIVDKLIEVSKVNGDSIAVSDSRHGLTYNQFRDCVFGLANELKERGINKGDVCAVLCNRNVYTLCSIFSIWAIGGVYVPLSQENPVARNESILRQCAAQVLIGTNDIEQLKLYDREFFDISISPKFIEFSDKSPSCEEISDSDLSYILFTSGSTGEPKGVKLNNGNLKNLFHSLNSGIFSQFSGCLNVALIAPFSFDASIQQIITSVLLGHSLYIAQDIHRKNPSELYDFLFTNEINIFDCTPTHIKMLNMVVKSKTIDEHKIRCIIIGGEILRADTIIDLAKKFKNKKPHIVNIYGVAECAVDSIYNMFSLEDISCSDIVPVGIPMEGTTVFICNENGEILGDGDIGEIYIGGLGVGSGYLDKTLNLNRFVRLRDFPNEIFYRTGDIAFKDDAGLIICLGRNDRQVKVRGNRVELTDIEACIMKFKPSMSKKIECVRCLLDSISTNINDDGICDVCRFFEVNESRINDIFNNSRDLKSMIRNHTQNSCKYDCMLLYSGGRDSTYVLIRLVEMGFTVLAYTFDNGYLSQQALENIARITRALDVDSVVEKSPEIDSVFSESLKKFSTVCDGCYKVLATMSTQYALDKGIPTVVTGLDKGQIIETKLMRLLEKGTSKSIDESLSEQRRVYHFWDNSFDSYLNTLNNFDGINNINFVDFYLHEDVSEQAVWDCIEKNGLWRKSQDTGLCSSNCLINDVGIFTHFRDKGFHNYAAPLSWDVRLNRICRRDGKAKLSMQMLDIQYIERMLKYFNTRNTDEICNCSVLFRDEKILAFIQSSQAINIKLLQEFVKNTLPPYMLPHRFIFVDEIPLTESGKVDNGALLSLIENNSTLNCSDGDGSIEAVLSEIWSNVLGHSDFNEQDNFFDVGGDSLDAIMMSSEIAERFSYTLQFGEIVEKLSIEWITSQIKSTV